MSPLEPQELILDVQGLRLAARAFGPDDGQPILALHGWLDNAATFDKLIPLLGDGLRIVSLDLPGHGLSEHRPPGCPYHFVDWIPAVLGAADAMGWTDFTLLGHSMGAAIGSLLGSVAGPRLERMVWIDALGVWTHPDDQAPTQLARSLREREILGEKSPRRMIDLEQAISVLGSAYADLSPESLEILLGRGLRQTEEGVEFRYDLQLRAASPMRLTEAQMIAFMNAITCPVFLVRPRQGWPSDEDTMKRRLEAVPDIRLMEIDGGHHAHLEYPERMADEIGKFLRGR